MNALSDHREYFNFQDRKEKCNNASEMMCCATGPNMCARTGCVDIMSMSECMYKLAGLTGANSRDKTWKINRAEWNMCNAN